jgi:tripartite-type tricarboxylate transporter receptor subunit TctC
MGTMLKVVLVVCAALTVLTPGRAPAQNYPAKAVRLVVPYPPGGATDLTARVMGQKLSAVWGQEVVVDNRPGSSGMTGANFVAKAAPDGYTVLVATSTEAAIVQSLYSKMTYSPERDLAPVTLAAVTPLILVVHPSVPANTVSEWLALAKTRPGQLTYASAGGTGSPHHLAGELLKSLAKVDIVHAPYAGAGPTITDLLAGKLSSAFVGMPPAMPHVRTGKLRALGVTTPTRSPAAPDVPTMAEAGVPGFDISNWFGVFVPTGTPREIVTKLNADMGRALRLAEVKDKLAGLGAEPVGNSPDEFAQFWRAEIAKYAKLIMESGVRAD